MVSIPPGSSLGRYRVVAQIGRGGMATVFRCHDPNLDRYVAVKVLPSYMSEQDPTFIGRFRQEAQTIAKLSHPNILQIYDFGDDKGFTFIVSEIVLGGDLQDKIGHGAMSLDEVLKYMGPLANALDYAHSQGIVHRDLKPSNVLLDTDDRPILADFGLARMIESAQRFTQEHQALGTPEYMSPEQAMGADADHRSDLYAFGIMVYQMLLGETPFRADTPAATLMAHVHKPLPLPTSINADIEPRLEANLLKALAKDPNDRFQSAKQMIDALAMKSGQAGSGVELDDFGATAVLDTSALSETGLMDAPTAVMGQASVAGQDATGAVATPAAEQPKPAGRPGWLLPAVGVAAGAVIAAVAAVLLLSGGEDEKTGEPATAAATATEAATPIPEPEISLAEALAGLQARIDEAKANVDDLRKIDLATGGAESPQVDIDFKTRDELETITRGFYKREDLRQQVFEANELYKTLGLMSEDEELEDILLGIQLQQVYALYDDLAEKVYVISESRAMGPAEELGVGAAYMAGLQQELFDISSLRSRARRGGADQYRAVDALIIGDIAQVLNGYIGTLSQDEYDLLTKPIPDNKLTAAPDVVQKANRFPRREGVNFVAEIFDRDDWDGLNAAYARPPATTEQVLHPEKYFEQEDPNFVTIPNIAGLLGKGWTQIGSNTFGEFLLRTYLEEHLVESRAAQAAAGWGGDRYSLLGGPVGERLLLLLLTWDSFEDSEDFYSAYDLFMSLKTADVEGVTTQAVGETGRRWITPDQTVFAGRIGPAVLLIIGDDDTLVQQGLDNFFEALSEPGP